MPPLAVAGVTAAATIGGAVISSSAQKKAAKSASNTAASNTAANNALATQTYNNNASRLDPTISGGLRAGNALSGMLLGPAAATPASAGGSGTFGGTGGGYTGPSDAAIAAMWHDGIKGNAEAATRARDAWYAANPTGGVQTNPGSIVGTVGAAGKDGTASALSPWDQFRNSTNYQWRLGQGNKALSQGWAARGALQSGAADKAAIEWNQNFAANELGRYQDLLAQQQGFGLTAASALAGVGQNMVGQVTANNNSAASAAANAALYSGQANANMYGGIASGIGTIAGAFGSSYRTPAIYGSPVGSSASAIGNYGW